MSVELPATVAARQTSRVFALIIAHSVANFMSKRALVPSVDLCFKRVSLEFVLHNKKACTGRRGRDPTILDIGSKYKWSTSRPGRF